MSWKGEGGAKSWPLLLAISINHATGSTEEKAQTLEAHAPLVVAS